MSRSPSIVRQALRLGWINGLVTFSGAPKVDLRGWLASGNYTVPSLPEAKKLTLYVPDSDAFIEAIAYDIGRMACSSFESVASISPVATMNKSLAWLAIKLYYAAFYSAHAFLRLQGTSCAQLDLTQTSKLAAVAQAYGFGSVVEIGFYTIKYEERTKNLTLIKADAKGGGSHEILWKEYHSCLNQIVDKVKNSSFLAFEKDEVEDKIKSLLRALEISGSRFGNWPSRVRNEINYRHGYGVWYPHGPHGKAESYIRSISAAMLADPIECDLGDEDSFDEFVRLCLCVISLTKCTIVDMASVHPERKSFHERNTIKVLKQAKLIK